MTRTFVVGNRVVGIRTNSEACAAWLDEVLADYAFVDEEGSEPFYSIYIASNGDRPRIGKAFHVLYREANTVIKTFDLSELGRALLGDLESHTFSERDDAIYLRCAPVTRNGTTAIVPSGLVAYMNTVGARAVERHGLAISEPTALAVDRSGGIAKTQTTLHVPADALDRLTEIAPSTPADRAQSDAPKSPDVVCLGNFWMDEDEPVRPVSRGYALYRLASVTQNLDTLRGEALAGLARLLEGVRCYELREGPAGEVVETLSAVLADQQ